MDQDQNPDSPASISYRDAGVDIDAGNYLIEKIKPIAQRTMRPEVMGSLGCWRAWVISLCAWLVP